MLASAIALSGMNAAQIGLQASAHNIANLSTERFHRDEIVSMAQSGGGVSASVTRSAEMGDALATDMVGLLQSKNAFLANLAVFKTSDRMAGSLLDLAG